MAATNFPESLDKALVRPGRFDWHVAVPNPDIKGRTEILGSHFKNVPRAPDVDLGVSSKSKSKIILNPDIKGCTEVLGSHLENVPHA